MHCNAIVNVSKYKSQNQNIKFLRGINDNYFTMRTQILLMDPLPSWNRVCSLLHNKTSKILVINPRQLLLLANEVMKTMLQPMEDVLVM